MDVISKREIRIVDAFYVFLPTITIFREAVTYLMHIVLPLFSEIEPLKSKERMMHVEKLVHGNSKRPARYMEFDRRFRKLPSYLRRSAITTAITAVALYLQNMKDWEANGRKGKEPKLTFDRDVMPALYHANMFEYDIYAGVWYIRVKLWSGKDWIWYRFQLSQADVRNILKECDILKEASSPSLKRHGHRFTLVFTIEKKAMLPATTERICAVDIGLNTHAVCAIMTADGTVLGRRFICFPVEEDRFLRILNEIRKAKSRSKCSPRRLWRFADYYNEALSILIASAICDYAKEMEAQTIVMENLGRMGKKHGGSMAFRLGLWRSRDIEKRVEHIAHRLKMRFSTVCARNTSRLAFDGSGYVKRDPDNRALCTFKTGKRYNADLNAAYNIGARYFIRDIGKTCSERDASELKAKVPEFAVRTRCTLSTSINLRIILKGEAA